MRLFAILLLVGFATGQCIAQAPPSTPVDGKIQWLFDLEEAQAAAKDADKPLFIVFRCER